MITLLLSALATHPGDMDVEPVCNLMEMVEMNEMNENK